MTEKSKKTSERMRKSKAHYKKNPTGHIHFVVSLERKTQWEKYAENEGTTLSRMIINAVNNALDMAEEKKQDLNIQEAKDSIIAR